ncbi:MAG: hypothetical protein FWC24_00625 [Treponema sp.]|nr:hypothetical protein [Treponema sp.]
MNEFHISALLLERYHIGEVTPEEKLHVENALARDAALAAALADMDRADKDFWDRFPQEKFFPSSSGDRKPDARRFRLRRSRRIPPLAWGLCAAAAVLIIAFPLFILRNSAQEDSGDRMKGTAGENSAELSVYLKGSSAGKEVKLPDQAGIQAGNTVQLIYRVQPESSGERYGVIFSVDGRASVTLHYPYKPGQSTKLVSGKAVPLDEAYTLDDAPEYEIFYFVVGDTPFEVGDVLNTAQQLAVQLAGKSRNAQRLGTAAFKNYDLSVLTLQKK